jgi:hypothetical protein
MLFIIMVCLTVGLAMRCLGGQDLRNLDPFLLFDELVEVSCVIRRTLKGDGT